MRERRAFELALNREYKEIERYDNQQINANSKLKFNQQMEQRKFDQTVRYQNQQITAGEAAAAATAEYRARPSKTQEELNMINSLPISQEQKNALIYGQVGGDAYDYPGAVGATPVVTPSATSEVDALSNYTKEEKNRINYFRSKGSSLEDAIAEFNKTNKK